jgi:hypothetical protein
MPLNFENPRETGRAAVKATIPDALWSQNHRFMQELRSKVLRHPIAAHPIREFLESETLAKDKSLLLHLEFGYGFAQVFTDAVLHAMARASQLEPRLGPRGKVTARFLWSLNLMDELGFIPSGSKESYAGNPGGAHYHQFTELFPDMGAPENVLNTYNASASAKVARQSFEGQYQDYVLLTTVLALSESVFDKYAGSWAYNTGRSTDVDVSKGYHTIHVKHDDGTSVDDDHSEDGWTLVCQAITPERYPELEQRSEEWLDAWAAFADNAMKMLVD